MVHFNYETPNLSLETQILKQKTFTNDDEDTFLIILKFSCESQTSMWLVHQDSDQQPPELLKPPDSPRVHEPITVYFHLQNFPDQEKALNFIDRSLDVSLRRGQGRRQLVDFAWKKAVEIFGAMPGCHDVIFLHFHVAEKIKDFYRRWPEAVDGLSPPESCSICLEEFSGGLDSDSVPLACGHIFHRECIKKWFGKRRDCPLCRADIGHELIPREVLKRLGFELYMLFFSSQDNQS